MCVCVCVCVCVSALISGCHYSHFQDTAWQNGPPSPGVVHPSHSAHTHTALASWGSWSPGVSVAFPSVPGSHTLGTGPLRTHTLRNGHRAARISRPTCSQRTHNPCRSRSSTSRGQRAKNDSRHSLQKWCPHSVCTKGPSWPDCTLGTVVRQRR